MNIEIKVLNAVLQNKDIQTVYTANIDEMFEAYADEWQAIKDYYTKYQSLPSAERISDVHPGFERVEVSEQTEFYVDKMRESYLQRRLQRLLATANDNVGRMSPVEIMGNIGRRISELTSMSSTAVDTDVMDMELAKKHYDDIRSKGGSRGIPTGIAFIDSSYPLGLAPGDLIVIFGWTGRGKSLLTTLIACNAHEQNFKPMILSLEMDADKIRDRVWTIKGSGLWNNTDLMMGKVDDVVFDKFVGMQQNRPAFIVINNDEADEVTPLLIEAKIDQHKPSVVILDYAQLMSDVNRSESMTQRMMNLSKELKRMAMRKQIPIVVISSATQDGVGKVDGPPGITNVAWSRQLAYDSDLAFSVHKYDDSNLIDVVCAKNRNGPLFAGSLNWEINEGKIEEVFT